MPNWQNLKPGFVTKKFLDEIKALFENCDLEMEPLKVFHFDSMGSYVKERPRNTIEELGAKLAVEILLADKLSGVQIPNDEQRAGFVLLERDGEI